MRKWTTHRGDEWYYSDQVVEATGDLNRATVPPAFSFSIQVRNQECFTADYLYLLIQRTSTQLSDCELWCRLDVTSEPMLKQLADEGRIEWELFEHPVSREARILAVNMDAKAT
jgi:hypothetical protein